MLVDFWKWRVSFLFVLTKNQHLWIRMPHMKGRKGKKTYFLTPLKHQTSLVQHAQDCTFYFTWVDTTHFITRPLMTIHREGVFGNGFGIKGRCSIKMSVLIHKIPCGLESPFSYYLYLLVNSKIYESLTFSMELCWKAWNHTDLYWLFIKKRQCKSVWFQAFQPNHTGKVWLLQIFDFTDDILQIFSTFNFPYNFNFKINALRIKNAKYTKIVQLL